MRVNPDRITPRDLAKGTHLTDQAWSELCDAVRNAPPGVFMFVAAGLRGSMEEFQAYVAKASPEELTLVWTLATVAIGEAVVRMMASEVEKQDG